MKEGLYLVDQVQHKLTTNKKDYLAYFLFFGYIPHIAKHDDIVARQLFRLSSFQPFDMAYHMFYMSGMQGKDQVFSRVVFDGFF